MYEQCLKVMFVLQPGEMESPKNSMQGRWKVQDPEIDGKNPNQGKWKNEDPEDEERMHFQRIVNAFRFYRKCMQREIQRKEAYMQTFPANHQELLKKYKEHLEELKVCLNHNAEIINLIIRDVACMFENVQHSSLDDCNEFVVRSTDMEKVSTTLRQIVRDWSEDGAAERESCYGPIIKTVERLYPADKIAPQGIQILVPGAGLGRLAYEFARRGYSCQGNEFSLFMLFASNFVLNKCHGVNTLRLYPWVSGHSNHLTNEDQLKCVAFPDVEPSTIPPSTSFTMAAGDFLEIYTEEYVWDCVASCFFIDCANNIVSFIEVIYKILKPGGYWVNLGPLLYHFEESPCSNSIEPSYEIIREIISSIGFKILEEKTNISTSYTQNPKSLLKYEYDSIFFLAQKPLDAV